jgi:hypothetical protein
VTQYPHGIVDGSYQGSFMTTEGGSGDHFVWWAHEKTKAVEGGRKFKGINHDDRIYKFTKVILDE